MIVVCFKFSCSMVNLSKSLFHCFCFNFHRFVAFQLGCYCPTVIASFALHTLRAEVIFLMPFAPEDMDLCLERESPFH